MQGHPWIYRDQVPVGFGALAGEFVELSCGRFRGFGVWDTESALAVRVYSRQHVPNEAWYRARVAEAWALRAPLLAAGTNAFRWIYGEADALPGIIVDHYAGFAVIVCDSAALRAIAEGLVPLLESVAPLKGVLFRDRDAPVATRLIQLSGRRPPAHLIVEENGLRMRADLGAGQKTGLFLDHRENRALIEQVAEGRTVLNLFAYSGAFSLYALRGGAKRVISVDIAPDAADDAGENVRLNGLDASAHHFEVADVFEYLEAERRKSTEFSLVICDPPSFARNKAHLDKALKAYTRVNAAGFKLAAEGGLYAAASCTGRVSPTAFRQCLAGAAARAQRRVQVVHERGQPVDHPELVGHPEGRYLKFLLGRVSRRV